MPRLSVFFLRAALIHLGIGFTMGALLLSNKGIPYAPVLWRLLSPHVELVLIGWTLQLAMGVAVWILPRFSSEPRYGNLRLGWWSFTLLNLGVSAVALGWWLEGSIFLITAGRLAELLAAGLFALHAWPRVKPLGGDAASTSNQKEFSHHDQRTSLSVDRQPHGTHRRNPTGEHPQPHHS